LKYQPALLLLLLIAVPGRSIAQDPVLLPHAWHLTNGGVTTILAQEGKEEVHMAGSFSYLDAPIPTASLALVDATNGNPDLGFAQGIQPIAYGGGMGTVLALCPDQNGGWFIGGQFTHVAGQARTGVARIDANGMLMPWATSVQGNVSAMGVFDDILVVATQVGSVYGLDKNSGNELWYTYANGAIHDLVIGVHDWNGLNPWFMIGGGFTSVSSPNSDSTLQCSGTAFINTLNGMPMAAGPSFYSTTTGAGGVVYDLELTEDLLYVGGSFDRVSPVPVDDPEFAYTRHNIAAFGMDLIDHTPINEPSGWAPEVLSEPGQYPYVKCLDHHNGKLYIGGEFRYVNGAPRNGLACVDASGWPTAWNPLLPAAIGGGETRIECILGHADNIHVAGYFSTPSEPYPYAAAFSENNAAQTGWKPGFNGYVEDMQVWGDRILVGGQFGSAGELAHPRLTALNALTGSPTATGFDANLYAGGGQPNCMARKGDTLFVGGEFNFAEDWFNAGPVVRLAAVDARTGSRIGFNPEVDDIVDCMLVAGDTLYIGGRFNVVNGEGRNGFAALNASTGELLDLDPMYAGEIRAMELVGDVIYLVGSIYPDGNSAYSAAAIDRMTGQFLPWLPLQVNATTVKYVNGHLYLGGQVYLDQTRGIVEVDPTSGALLPWQPEVNESAWVQAIAGYGNKLIVGGYFSVMGGQPRSGLAMLDQSTGEATPWDPQVSEWGNIESIAIANNRLYVAGGFSSIAGSERNGFAMFSLPALPEDCLGVPGGSATVGTACDDGDAGTENDVFDANCECQGTPIGGPCTGDQVVLNITTDANPGQISWEFLDADNNVVASGSPATANAVNSATVCLGPIPDGCYGLRLYDSFGDGITGGGWELRTTGGKLILRDDFANGGQSPDPATATAPYNGAHSFCLPLGAVDIAPTECGIFNNQQVNKVYCNKVAGATQYQFEFSDPDAGRIRRIVRSTNYVHFSDMVANPLVPGVKYFARVRTNVDGPVADAHFGSGCEMGMAPLSVCSQLIQAPAYGHSCNETRTFNTNNSFIYAKPVVGATEYQFRIFNIGEGYDQTFTRSTYILQLKWNANVAPPLVNGSTYSVEVNVKVSGVFSGFCPSNCNITINNGGNSGLMAGTEHEGFGDAMLWPNPVRDGQVNLDLTGLKDKDQRITLDIQDIYGNLVFTQAFANNGARFSTVLQLPGDIASGVYLVNITVNGEHTVQRLSIIR
jgi:hypothetical protein